MMSSILRLRVDKFLGGPSSTPPKVFAKIYPLGEGARRVPGSKARQELVPISDQPEQAVALDFAPGHYYVETVLPSGEILADDVSLEEGETEELVLRAEHSPHEWLSWQHLAGNVPARQVVEQRAEETQATRGGSQPRTLRSAKGGGAKGGAKKTLRGGLRRGSSSRSETPIVVVTSSTPEVNLGRPLVWLSGASRLSGAGVAGRSDVWGWLAGLQGTDPDALILQLSDDRPARPVPPQDADEEHAVCRVSSAYFTGPASRTDRHFAAVPRADSVELIILPLPWGEPAAGREADVEIAVREPAEPADFCASAVARDDEFGLLLAYLSSGALPTARQMAETAQQMLYEKMENPYAAAAGAYALVGTAVEAAKRDWHDWVRNLMNWFEHVPDGAIQWGQLRMRMRRSQSDLDEAREAFKLAYRRGLPFYSMGVRWLLDGLELVSHGDPEAGEMLKHVRQLAWRTNFQQPFTILRLGGRPRV